MNIIPLNRKILIKPHKIEETKTDGGIYLAEKPNLDTLQGEVIALGDKVELKLKKGDKVLYEEIGADKVENLLIIDENKIIAKLG